MKIGGEKMRNASSQQGENEQQWKPTGTQATKLLVCTNMYNISFIRCVTRDFHAVAVQNNVEKKVGKKVCC